MCADVRKLKDAGVDAVNVPDGPRAQSRMGALLTSVIVDTRLRFNAKIIESLGNWVWCIERQYATTGAGRRGPVIFPPSQPRPK